MNRLAWQGLSLLLLGVVWQVAAVLAPSPVLPSPVEVGRVLAAAVLHGDLVHHLAVTLARVAGAFVVALSLGAALGVALGRLPWLDRLLDGWVVFFLNLPALVTAIVCFVWFGLGEAAALAAVSISKLPAVVVTVREGARALDPGFDAVARSGLALIWKIVLMVELLGRSDGIGFKLHVFFQSFDVTGILAYSLAFIAVVQAVELAILAPLDRRCGAWRG